MLNKLSLRRPMTRCRDHMEKVTGKNYRRVAMGIREVLMEKQRRMQKALSYKKTLSIVALPAVWQWTL
jgi:hypothetical protein